MSRHALASVFLLGLLLASAGCAAPHVEPELPVAEPAPAERPAMTVYRDELDAVLHKGLQPLIAELDLRPALDTGRFLGWRVQFLRPGEPPYRGSAVRPGDIVTAVNGQPVERPDQMMALWKSLREAGELRFSILRAGQAQAIVYRVIAREP